MRHTLAAATAIASLTALLAGPSRAAVIALSPDPLNFGEVLVGTTSVATLTVTDTAAGRNQPVTGVFSTSPHVAGGGGSFALPAQGASTGADYAWSPTKQGATLGGNVGATGTAQNGNTSSPTVSLSGTAVAPVESVDVSSAGNVRIGTTGTSSVTVANVGDGNLSGAGAISNLNGIVGGVSTNRFNGAGGSFSLTDSSIANFSYTYTPKGHTTNTATVAVDTNNGSADGKNQPASTTLKLSGTGVGPIYSSSSAPGTTIDIGSFAPGVGGSVSLTIANLSADPGGADLTGLTLLRDRIRGVDPGEFAVGGFTRGDLLDEGDSVVLDLDFLGASTPGLFTANLRFVTDQDAALGTRGDVFTYHLEATVVPEPASLALLASGLLGLILRRRRKAPG